VAEQTSQNELSIRIEDDGPGLDPALYDDVFKPFFRGDQARSQSQTHGSVGLGLSIAMDIIHAHGGQIHLQPSENHGGLSVHIQLPL
jgi:two-component system osmolarity sensor histidine kinase EnvZ